MKSMGQRVKRVVHKWTRDGLYIWKGGEFGSSDKNRTVENKMLRESKQMNEDILKMFGDDLNATVMIERFRFGAVSEAREGFGKTPRRQGVLMGSEKREKRVVRLI